MTVAWVINSLPSLHRREVSLCHVSQLAYVDYEHVIVGLAAYRSLSVGQGRGHFEAFVRLDVGTEGAT